MDDDPRHEPNRTTLKFQYPKSLSLPLAYPFKMFHKFRGLYNNKHPG